MERSESERARWGDVLGLTALAGVYRLLFVWAMPRAIDTPDAVGYLEMARGLAAGDAGALGSGLPVLYPLLCAPLLAVGLEAEAAGQAVSLAAGLALIPAVYCVVTGLFNGAVARVACLAVALWPWLADYAWRISPDGLALALWFASFGLLVRAIRQGGGWPYAAGLSFFALHLARPEGTFLFLGSIVPAALLVAGEWRLLGRFVPLAAVPVSGMAVQALLMRLLTGSASVNVRVTDPSRSLEFLFVERGAEVARALLTLGLETIPLMVGPYLFLFAGVGLLRVDGRRDCRGEGALLLFVLGHWLLAGMSSYAEPRYVLGPVVAVSIWGACGVVVTMSALGEASGGWRRAALLPLVGLVAWQGLMTGLTVLPEHFGRLPRMPHEYRLAGEWLRAHGEPGLVITRRTQIGFYAGMPATGPGETEPLPELIARAQRIGARYLVVDERHGVVNAPALAPLLEPSNAPPGLRLLADGLSPYPGGRIVIYAIEAGGE